MKRKLVHTESHFKLSIAVSLSSSPSHRYNKSKNYRGRLRQPLSPRFPSAIIPLFILRKWTSKFPPTISSWRRARLLVTICLWCSPWSSGDPSLSSPSLLAARDLPKAMVCSRLLGPADRGEPRLHFLFSSLLNEAFLGFFSFLAFFIVNVLGSWGGYISSLPLRERGKEETGREERRKGEGEGEREWEEKEKGGEGEIRGGEAAPCRPWGRGCGGPSRDSGPLRPPAPPRGILLNRQALTHTQFRVHRLTCTRSSAEVNVSPLQNTLRTCTGQYIQLHTSTPT